MENELYSIGKVEELCNITKKALRYYDKIGILSPDKVADESGYRYYSKNNLLSVPVIKYYKQSGFKLEELKNFRDDIPYWYFEKNFKNKIQELRGEEREINTKLKSLGDWHDLIVEAQMVIENNLCDVSAKCIRDKKMLFFEQDFNYDYMESLINIPFTNYIESMDNAITGPVIIHYPSRKDKMDGKCKRVTILQEVLFKCDEEKLFKYGGHLALSCYHIGPYENIDDTYKKIEKWAEEHGYLCSDDCYERYVTDYWTTKNTSKFVTEIIVEAKKIK